MESYLEKYTILSSLGNQSKRKFSSVFLIEEIESKEKYVLKKIKKTSSNQHLVERLIQESTFNFTHQQLPSIKQTYENNSELILIIQFINGKDLNE